jgi:frataxin
MSRAIVLSRRLCLRALNRLARSAQLFAHVSRGDVATTPCRFSTQAPPSLSPVIDFHDLADSTLNSIEVRLTSLEDFVDDLDISNAMGVLTLQLGTRGTYVLNKQAPNQQIWWSSPMSGPKRFEFCSESRRWVSTRDRSDMLLLLSREIEKLTGHSIKFE